MRPRNNKIASCNGEAIISFIKEEEIEKQRRRNSFMRSNCPTAELYLFSMSVKREINKFKLCGE